MNHPNDIRNDDKVLDHTRRQLSALVDGELAPDEARFLLRRLEHDGELGGCWERWQLAGELMRGRGGAVLPADFAGRVATAVAGEAVPVSARPRRWLHWGGGAIAASVALVALLLARPAGEPASSPAPALASNAPATAAPAVPAATLPATPPRQPAPAVPDAAGTLATVVAAAEVPRRVASARRGNAQAQRAAARLRERREAPVAVAANAPVESGPVADPRNPFSPGHVLPPSRPWPRALVPGMGGEGGFTVEYGAQAPSSAFYPFAPGAFQPRRGLAPVQAAPQAEGGDTP